MINDTEDRIAGGWVRGLESILRTWQPVFAWTFLFFYKNEKENEGIDSHLLWFFFRRWVNGSTGVCVWDFGMIKEMIPVPRSADCILEVWSLSCFSCLWLSCLIPALGILLQVNMFSLWKSFSITQWDAF